MAGDSEGSECAEVTTVFEGEEGEGDEDEEDCFFVDVPAEEEGGVGAEGEGANKCGPGRVEEKAD